MTHLSPDEIVDALEGGLRPERQRHILECRTCAAEVEQLRGVLTAAQQATVPEPSPLFWQYFSARVREQVAAEAAGAPRWPTGWLRWRVLAPVAALTLIVLALSVTMSREPVAVPQRASLVSDNVSAASPIETASEQEWAALTEIVGPVDLEAAQGAGILSLGDAERALLQLSADEQEELLRLLQEEMGKVGS